MQRCDENQCKEVSHRQEGVLLSYDWHSYAAGRGMYVTSDSSGRPSGVSAT